MIQKNQETQEKIENKLKKAVKQEEKSLAGFFIKRFRFTYLIIGIIFLMGFYTLFTIPKEAEPEIRVPFALINTVYFGATPQDMEELVTNKIEEEVKDLDNLKEYKSSSGQGFSSVFVEFNAEADIKESLRKLKEAVDEAEPNLPSEAETPYVQELNFNDLPIITYSLVGDYSEQELKNYADLLQEKLESIKGVSEAKIIGGREREFQVIVNQTKLANYNLSLSQVISAVQTSNFDLPAGDIEVDGFEYNVRVQGKFKQAQEMNDIVIATYDNSPVFLRDIAQVKDSFKEKESEARLGLKNQEPKNTISLEIYKKTGGNILNIVKEAEDMINSKSNTDSELNNILPKELKIVKTGDNAVYIKEDISTLGFSGIQTFILIFLILMLILSVQGAIITALSVPIAFLIAFFGIQQLGMTINGMVLFSLVLSLGLMVDNSIVVIEGINEYISEHKKTIYEAALLSIWNFKWAIISGTMTTIAAFLPLWLFVSGIMGEYLGIIPKTLITTLLASLFVAIIIIPTLSSRFIKIKTNGSSSHRNKKRHLYIQKKMDILRKKYVRLMKNVLANRKERGWLIAGVLLFFLVASLMPVMGFMKIQMFPKVDFDFFNVKVELPTGTIMGKTSEITAKTEKLVAQIPELDNYVSNINGNTASIAVNLISKDDRKRKSYEIAESIRPKLEAVQGGDITLQEMESGPPTGSPIEVRIYGKDMAKTSELAGQIKKFFENQKGVINVKDSMQDASGEWTFTVDKQKANYYGLSVTQIASTLRNAIYGSKASVVNINKDDVDITVKYAKDAFTNINDLENVLLFTPQGNTINVSQVADVKLQPALLSIDHRDGKNIVTVTADTEENVDLRKVIEEFNNYKKELTIPSGFSIDIGGETEDIQKSFTEMFLSMFIAVILIYGILVLMFDSFKHPFIIIFSLPLAIPGVIFGLMITGQAFSITSFIGVVALAGIVVNDAIVLIDRINKNMKDKMDFKDALIEGGTARMQPIFVTSLTTIAGIFPLIYASEMWRGLSLTVIFGLAFATVLTLVIMPVMYYGIVPEWRKRKITAFLLASFLGIFSLHKIYLGNKKSGYTRLFIALGSIVAIIISGVINIDLFKNIGSAILGILALFAMIEVFLIMVSTNEELTK